MNTDQQIYTLLGADPELLAILTDGIRIRGAYHFEALELKGLDRRSDGVLLPEDTEEPIWVIEFQAQSSVTIYHRLVIEMGLIGERHPERVVRGLILFATRNIDPKTQPWYCATQCADPPLRVAYLNDVLDRLETQDPTHPLLAVFLPYRTKNREDLRHAGLDAYERIQGTPLPDRVKTSLLDVFWSWLVIRFDELTYKEILHMFGNVTSLEQTRAYKDILAMGRQEGRHEGWQEGRQEGKQEGQHEGRKSEAYSLILRLAKHRFGTLPAGLDTRIQDLPLSSLETLAEALLDFTVLQDLQVWLDKN